MTTNNTSNEEKLVEILRDALRGKPWPLDKPDSLLKSFERIADALIKLADNATQQRLDNLRK